MHLPFARLPRPLRWLTWLLALDATVRIVRWASDCFGGRPVSFAKLCIAGMPIVAAILLFRGRRQGLDWLLYYCGSWVVVLAVLWSNDNLVVDGPVIAGGAALLGIAAYAGYCHQRLPWREPGSFGDWMTNPGFREGMAEWFAERNRLVEADRRNPPDADEVVRGLLVDERAELARHRVQALPEHFGPAVLRALDDPAFRRDADALGTLVHVLPESLHQRAAGKLAACLQALEGKQRRETLRILAATGSAEFLPMLVAELGEDHADAVAEGLTAAATAGRLDADARRAIEPALRRRLAAGDCPKAVVVALAALAPDLPLQLAHAANRDPAADAPLRHLLALGDAGMPLPADETLALWRRERDRRQWHWCDRLLQFVPVPDDELAALLDELPASFGGPDDSVSWDDADRERTAARETCVSILRVLVARHGRLVAPRIEAAIALGLPRLSDGAAALLLRAHGVPEDYGLSRQGALTPAQRHLRCLSRADSYTCNGGLAHAMDCLDADDWEVLETALHAVAPPAVRDIWITALRAVSPEPLPSERRQRTQIVMRHYEATDERLDALSRQYFGCNWQLTVAMAKYALAHRDQLGAITDAT